MRMINLRSAFYIIVLFSSLVAACGGHEKVQPLFEVMESKETGLYFTNKLEPHDSFNVFHYMYFYNGAGVGAGLGPAVRHRTAGPPALLGAAQWHGRGPPRAA